MAYYSGGLEDLDQGNDECVEIAFNLEDWDDSMDYSSLVTSAARKGRLEVRLRKMNDKDKLLFQDAMKNEAGGWLTAEAVRIVARHNVDPSRLLRCRFVLTWKENPEDGTKKAKARLVILGFADPDLRRRSDRRPRLSSRYAREAALRPGRGVGDGGARERERERGTEGGEREREESKRARERETHRETE